MGVVRLGAVGAMAPKTFEGGHIAPTALEENHVI